MKRLFSKRPNSIAPDPTAAVFAGMTDEALAEHYRGCLDDMGYVYDELVKRGWSIDIEELRDPMLVNVHTYYRMVVGNPKKWVVKSRQTKQI